MKYASAAVFAVALLTGFSGQASAQTSTLVLANPDWNITLTDYGYSDFLLDNTPGFEGREYLSGEWGAAVAYQVSGVGTITPKWLEPNFSYPNWVTNSNFTVLTPIALTGVPNANNLPIAQSKIANSHLEITIRHEMLDTVVGTPMGTAGASAGTGASINSSRYVMKQTLTLKNISGAAISNLQLFQFLHGLQSQRGVYDNRSYNPTGPLGAFRYDVTQAGVDQWAVGAGSSTAGLEDFIGFHASLAPSGYEIGYYGIEGNGVDNHSMGKPSVGVHFSIEDNWQNAPYSTRLGTDTFTPAQRWIGGAERWDLGGLAAGASVSHDVILSVRTGTRVPTGTGSTGGCNGGASVPGGLDYGFENATSSGSCFASYTKADAAELEVRIAAGKFTQFTFPTPGSPAQVWEVEFSGTYSGAVNLTFSYDRTLLPAGFDESTLAIHQFSGGAWHALTRSVDPGTHTITVSTGTLGAFALGVAGGNTFLIAASASPVAGGTVTGAGTYPQASQVTLVATASAGNVFANWTEGGSVVSTSPSYTFSALAARTLVANFVDAGSAFAISTSSSPTNGGTTSGDGAYANNASATVVATANPGYKFTKWLVNGSSVSTATSYNFLVTSNRALVAVFKPIYVINVTYTPAGDFEVEPDTKPPAGYELGEKATVKVNHTASGYSFVHYTQNGVVVSTDPTFGFTVTANRDLVAHFALGHRMDLSADPKTAGTASGGGVYTHGGPVTVVAVPKPGYVFTKWTESGGGVSTTASFAFTSTVNRTLVANFVTVPTLDSVAVPGGLMFAWPASASDWVLQESTDLLNWTNSTRVVNVVAGKNQVTVSPFTGKIFFRLQLPEPALAPASVAQALVGNVGGTDTATGAWRQRAPAAVQSKKGASPAGDETRTQKE